MSALTGTITFNGHRLPVRHIGGGWCVSTSGLALALGRHPGRIRSILSATRRRLPGVLVEDVACQRAGRDTWWSPAGIRDLAKIINSNPFGREPGLALAASQLAELLQKPNLPLLEEAPTRAAGDERPPEAPLPAVPPAPESPAPASGLAD